LPKEPERTTKRRTYKHRRTCPSCGEAIFVCTGQRYFDSVNLTEPQAKELQPYGKWGIRSYRLARERLILGLGREPSSDEVMREASAEAERTSPATFAQLCFALDIGIAPTDLSSSRMSRLLTAFQELRVYLYDAWPWDDSEGANDSRIGAIIEPLVNDAEFQRLAQRADDWRELRLNSAAKTYLKAFLKERLSH
jgi:hypothetical protein